MLLLLGGYFGEEGLRGGVRVRVIGLELGPVITFSRGMR